MNNLIKIPETSSGQLQQAFEIIQACSAELSKSGLNHWSEYYTDFETYKHKIEENGSEVFIIYFENKPAATVTISSSPPKYYVNPEFGPYTNFIQFFTKVEPEDSVLYISALGVHPDFQGRGLAKSLMLQVEQLAKERDVKAIRFDTRTEFLPAVNLYESLGYKIVFKDVVSENENYNYYEKFLE